MTLYQAPVRLDHARPEATRPLLVALVAGAALGVVDLVLQLTLPYPWADLANSSAVWAVAALLLARALATDVVRSAVAGAVSLVVAVEAYYLLAIVLDKAGTASLVAPTTVAWMVMGVIAGAGFGVAGAFTRHGDTWLAAAGLGLGVAVLLAEAWQRVDWDGTAVLTAALAVALLATAARRPALLGRAALLAVVMTPVCYQLFRFAGFGI